MGQALRFSLGPWAWVVTAFVAIGSQASAQTALKCAADSECAAGETCAHNRCTRSSPAAVTQGLGNKCALSAECPGELVCVRNKCSQPEGAVAPPPPPPPLPSPSSPPADPVVPVPPPAATACTDDAQCGPDQACILQLCRKAQFQRPPGKTPRAESRDAPAEASPAEADEDEVSAKNAFYLEALGMATAGGTVNYERRLGSYFVGHCGLGASYGRYAVAFVVTAGVAALIGSAAHKFELGAAVTGFVPPGVFDQFLTINPVYLGYRYHPGAGGFIFRVGVTFFVAVSSRPFVFPWGGASFGYAF